MSNNNQSKKQREEVYTYIKGYDLEAISKAKVMVVGAGALGNEVLKNLALLNIGQILIVDFDIIEAHNLSRSVLFRPVDCDGRTKKSYTAAKRLKEINPFVKVKVINGDILSDVGLGVFKRMDSIISCLDNLLARQSINRSAFKVDASWIDGGLNDSSGMVASYKQGHSCFECNLSDDDRKTIQDKYSCPDKYRRYASEGRMPTTPINASIIAALQTQESMNEINQLHEDSILGKSVKYFGKTVDMFTTILNDKHEAYCLSNDTYSDIIPSENLSADMLFDDFINWAKSYFKSDDITLMLDHDFIIQLMSEESGKIFIVNKSRMALEDNFVDSLKESSNDVMHFKKTASEIDDEFIGKGLSLRDLGIPYLHIVYLLVDGKDFYVELTGDEHFLNFE